MKTLLKAIVSVWVCLFCGHATVQAAARDLPRRLLFDNDWRFHLGDVNGAEAVGYDDKAWRRLDLPHDWSIEGAVDKNEPAGNDGGYLPTGIGWYRKSFTLPEAAAGRKVWLYFEGIYERSSVYVNGRHVGGHPYGYTSFYCDVTEAVQPGQKNIIAVRADNSHQKNCRWYSGSGIYRHVWLITANRLHVANQGVFITTPSPSEAAVSVTVRNENPQPRNLTLSVKLGGLGSTETTVSVPADSFVTVSKTVPLSGAKLWSPENPQVYTATVELCENGRTVDVVEQRFGVRTITYSATDGLRLNGKPIKLNGCCVHHDNGVLGAAAFSRADYRRAQIIKSAGFNAVRTSHNLPSEAFLDACDELGLLVIDEAFDGWREAKNTNDYSTLFDRWWSDDVTAMVLRDRNHPSIFCWSIGNEVIERKKIEIVTTAKRLRDAVREFDPTRPVTSALASWDRDWEIYDPLAAQHDIVGYNYMIHKHATDHARVPERVMMQTESYPRDAFRNWALLTDNSYIVGDFVWTGMDYIGESGIGRWWYSTDTPGEHYERPLYPWHGSYCGDIDLIGWRKPISHYRSILHGSGEKLYMAVREPDGYQGKISTGLWAVWPTWESWNWPGHEGKNIDVDIYSRYSSVRLYLDGRLIGEKPTTRAEQFRAVFTIPYQAGELRAEGIEDGTVRETRILRTAGAAAVIAAVADRTVISADGQDLSFITIEIKDSKGNIVPDAACPLTATIKGNAVIAATGNADMQDTTPYTAHTFKTWKGRALVVVKGMRKAGNATLTLLSPSLRSATVRLSLKH